ncbi:MAG: hypothetical protein U9R19_03725, partial [Bacteroidota bacterium]|nr:hypothetical protein [Bacteroidota bacterium]
MNFRIFALGIMLVLANGFSFAQPIDSAHFEDEYQKLLQVLIHSQDSLEQLLQTLDTEYSFDNFQKARLNLIRIEAQDLFNTDQLTMAISDPEILSDKNIPILEKARRYLGQNRATLAIPLVMKYLETVATNSDSADFARITLAECYRKIKDFQKGKDLVEGLLTKPGLSLKNRAYAWNRLAAFYAEYNFKKIKNQGDSVLKYSKLCEELSKKHGFVFHLATSQNELAYYYKGKKNFELSLAYAQKAHTNFLKEEELAQAMRTVSNIAQIYIGMKKYSEAIDLLLKTIDETDMENNRSAFVSFYLSITTAYAQIGNFPNAYKYLRSARVFQSLLHGKNIKAQIYDLATQYETKKKEAENKELRMSNQIKESTIKQKNTILLATMGIIIVLLVLLVLIYWLFQKRNQAYKALVDQNLKASRLEKKLEKQVAIDFDKPKVSNENNTGKKHNQLSTQFERFLIEEKPFLWEDFSLDEACKKLNTNRSYLSRAINEHFTTSFSELLCDYRIRHAR